MGRDKIIRTYRKPRSMSVKPDPIDSSDKTRALDSSPDPSNLSPDCILGVPNPNPDPNPNFNEANWSYCTEEQLQEVLLKNLELVYMEAISKLVMLGYDEDLALKSILRTGHCYGNLDILNNVLHHAIAYLNSIGSNCNSNSDIPEFSFANLRQLEEYALAGMICLLQQNRPELSKGEAMWCLLMSNLHVGLASAPKIPPLNSPCSTDGEVLSSYGSPACTNGGMGNNYHLPGLFDFHGSWGSVGAEFPAALSFCESEMREIKCPKRFHLSPSMKAMLKRNVAVFAAGFRANTKAILQARARQGASLNSLPSSELQLGIAPGSESLSVQYEEKQDSQYLSMVNSVVDSLANISMDEKTDGATNLNSEMISNLMNQIKDLELQLKERRDWANQKAIQAARKLSSDLKELKMLRMEREDTLQQKGKQALGDTAMKSLSEMENALRKASGQVDHANAAVRRLENENAEMRAELVAFKLSAAESVTACLEIEKREKKYLKRLQVWENQKAKLQEEIAEEKQKIIQLQQQLQLVKDAQKETEVKWKQEQKAKILAIAQVEEEWRAKEAAEASVKRRQEALHRKIEIDFQRHKDDIQRLEQELTCLRASADLPRPYFPTNTSGKADLDIEKNPKLTTTKMLNDFHKLQEPLQKDVNCNRECLMCMKDEVSVVFLPCAHQVLCANCNAEHEKAARSGCPRCSTQIEQRIHVYGAS